MGELSLIDAVYICETALNKCYRMLSVDELERRVRDQDVDEIYLDGSNGGAEPKFIFRLDHEREGWILVVVKPQYGSHHDVEVLTQMHDHDVNPQNGEEEENHHSDREKWIKISELGHRVWN